MKRVKALLMMGILIGSLLGISGCKPETKEKDEALVRAKRAELRIATLEADLAKLKATQGNQESSQSELYDQLMQTKDDLAVAMETLLELESENSQYEKRLNESVSLVETLQQRLSEKDRDLKELEILNRELNTALEQVEQQLKALEDQQVLSMGQDETEGNLEEEQP